MGIKHFFHWFKQNFPECVDSVRTEEPLRVGIDTLGLDLNGIFHPVAQKVFKYGKHEPTLQRLLLSSKKEPSIQSLRLKCFEEVCKTITELVNVVRPKKRLVLCIDGVAPFAKQKQQRDRRFKSAKEQSIKKSQNVSIVFDSCEISPGTKFMHYLSKYIDWYIRKQKSNGEWKHLDIVFSSEKVPGEGEHAVMNVFKSYCSPSEKMMIYGLDCITADTPLLVRDTEGCVSIINPHRLCCTWKTVGDAAFGKSEYEVWSDIGWTHVRAVKRTVSKKPILRIITRTGIVDVTNDHKMLLRDGTERRAKECSIGDTLLSCPPRDMDISEWILHSRSEMIMMGAWWMNGYITPDEWGIRFPQGTTLELTDIPDVQIRLENDELVISTKNKMFIHTWECTFIHHSKKIIPSSVLCSDTKHKEYFIHGLLLVPQPLSFTSRKQVQSLFVLFTSVGRYVEISLSYNNVYTLTFSDTPVSADIIDIQELPFEDPVPVFDLETSNHHFQAGCGSIIVHNCDLVMLCLATRLPNIYIYRDNMFDTNERFVIDIGKCATGIQKRLKTSSAVTDFIFLCFMVGNDFLPQIPGIEILNNGIELLLQVYQETCLPFGLVNNDTFIIRHQTLLQFFDKLKVMEVDALKRKYLVRKRYKHDELLEKHFRVVDHSEQVENSSRSKIVECDFTQYKRDYYDTKLSIDDSSKVCEEYIKGLQWVILYYCKGVPNWTWSFPYNYGPFVDDLANCRDYTYTPFIYTEPLQPYEQLLGVLPPQSVHLLPKTLQHLMVDETSPMIEYYPKEIEIDVSGKRADWEGIAQLRSIPCTVLRNEYKQYEKYFSSKEKVLNTLQRPIQYRPCNNYTFKSIFGDIQHCKVISETIQ